jgi:hypothetical protein
MKIYWNTAVSDNFSNPVDWSRGQPVGAPQLAFLAVRPLTLPLKAVKASPFRRKHVHRQSVGLRRAG